MPLDPELSLDLSSAKPQPVSAEFGNPLSTIGSFATIQNQLNQARLFQQTFAARQLGGQIIAASPDLDTAVKNLYRNPLVSGYAPELANTVRQSALTLAQLQGVQAGQASTGLEALFKNVIPAMISNPASAQSAAEAQFAAMSPYARGAIAGPFKDIVTSLTEGLPSDPNAARAELNKRAAGMALGAGVTPEVLNTMLGTVTPQTVTGPYGPGGATITRVIGGIPQAQGPATPQSNILVPSTTPAARSNSNAVSPNTLTGPSIQQSEYYTKSGGAAADLQQDMQTQAASLPGSLKRLDMMTDALGNFQAGGGAELRMQIAKAMQAVKNAGGGFITDQMINDMGNNSLPDTQVFNAEVKPLVISELKAAAQGTGRVMRSEVDAFLSMMDNTNDPKALMQLLNQARYSLQVGYDQSQKFPQFKQLLVKNDPSVKGMDLSDFYSWYNKGLNPSVLPSTTGGGLPLGPVPVTTAKGVTPGEAAITHIWVPGKGLQPYAPPKGQ